MLQKKKLWSVKKERDVEENNNGQNICLSRRDEVKKMTEKINIYFWKIKRVEHRNKEYDLLLLSTLVFTFIFDFATVSALVYVLISTLNVFMFSYHLLTAVSVSQWCVCIVLFYYNLAVLYLVYMGPFIY